MNAFTRTAESFASALAGHPVRGGYEALRQIVDLYDNDDAIAREYAEEAFNAGRAAYWSSATHHNAVACELLNAANRVGSLEDAIRAIVPPFKRDRMQVYLDALVPLNEAAERELSVAYAKYTATWRDEPELAMRRVRKAVA
ncbi:hypothetical protein [Mesorhizobium sp. CAU 1741]|uniref:hypothetical protein n=1 Tax=Mesorhizobium sp. CAU 1741 TaxID=3140366 RepID=UPI00325BE941